MDWCGFGLDLNPLLGLVGAYGVELNLCVLEFEGKIFSSFDSSRCQTKTEYVVHLEEYLKRIRGDEHGDDLEGWGW